MKSVWMTAGMVGVGGFLGTLARYTLTTLIQRQMSGTAFPYGTLGVNLLGCLAIGAFAGVAESRQLLDEQVRAFVVVGVLGGFTTFSAFGYDTFTMVRAQAWLPAVAHVAAHVGIGAALAGVGYLAATR